MSSYKTNPIGGRKNTQVQLQEANATIETLREQLGAQLDPDPNATFLALGQEVRDSLAVRALFVHCADMYAALRQLGFDTKDKTLLELRAMAKQVFDTPGVHAKLTANLQDFEGQRLAMIARQVQIALHGTDENSTRAFATLARTLGWQKTPDVAFVKDNRMVNVWQLFDQPKDGRTAALPAATDGLAALNHEPGAAVKIDVEEDLPDGVIVADE